jgi:hypothetical protein
MKTKSKNKLVILFLKISVILFAFYFIYAQINQKSDLKWYNFILVIRDKFSLPFIIILLFLSFANRFLEILKWKNLVSYVTPISTFESTKQVLAALTAGIITPNGIGEYAGKALFFEKTKSKIILFLNLICNGIQMIYTILFGIIGLFILKYYQFALTLLGIGLLLLLIAFLTKNFTLKGYSLYVFFEKIKEIPKQIHRKNIFLGFSRYFIFSHQYYLLFVILGVDLQYTTLISTIAVVYFLASSLPSFQMFDFAVKGSVALFFFGKYDINEWIILFVSSLMWFLNVVLPVTIGSIFVLKFKSKWK